MQKTYWWRIALVVVSLAVLIISYVGPCGYNLGRCLGGNNIIVVRTLFHIFLAIFTVSPFLFLIHDGAFLKWLRISCIWFAATIILILLMPEYSGGWISFGPTKESVSIWMGALFVAISLAKIVWDARQEKK